MTVILHARVNSISIVTLQWDLVLTDLPNLTFVGRGSLSKPVSARSPPVLAIADTVGLHAVQRDCLAWSTLQGAAIILLPACARTPRVMLGHPCSALHYKKKHMWSEARTLVRGAAQQRHNDSCDRVARQPSGKHVGIARQQQQCIALCGVAQRGHLREEYFCKVLHATVLVKLRISQHGWNHNKAAVRRCASL